MTHPHWGDSNELVTGSNTFDVIVVGGGHAGCEAAAAAARRGARVALVTFDAANIGAMSCNPAIGGVGKGHMVREIDALGGILGMAADAAGIHYRILNRSKGPAVQGPRVQADRRRFAAFVQREIARQEGITTVIGEAVGLCRDGGRVSGVALAAGNRLRAPAVVLATGTFLGGRLFRGAWREAGGRVEERAATGLANALRDLGIVTGRVKTGTPPRLDGRTINWSRLARQPSDADPWTMSPMTRGRQLPQLDCAITRTNARTHDIIRASLDQSPLRSGEIVGGGPRYCPSIEDKVERFGDRDGHQIFLEPEQLDHHWVYPNGISTCLPEAAQAEMIRTIAGLERARIAQWGYAVEYDHIDPRALDDRLAMIELQGLFCAGQINGTTGYEEAAGQGLIAGANAAALALGKEPLRLDRADSYLGVMVDDLTVQGVSEPYRMMTARAEYRLRLRADNAETRLSMIGAAAGLLDDERLRHVEWRMQKRVDVEAALDGPITAGRPQTFRSVARASDEASATVSSELVAAGLDFDAVSEALTDLRYEPYVERQQREVAARRRDGDLRINPLFDFAQIPGLSNEMVERLAASKPHSLDAASRIRGITPAALSALAVALHNQ